MRQLGPHERHPSDVPFNVLPLLLPQGGAASGGGVVGRTSRFIGVSGTPSNVIKTHANVMQQRPLSSSAASGTEAAGSSVPYLSGSAVAAATLSRRHDRQQPDAFDGDSQRRGALQSQPDALQSQPDAEIVDLQQQAALRPPQQQRDSSQPGSRLDEMQRHAGEMQQLLAHQRDLVRQLKEGGGRDNADPEVRVQVQRLLQLKVGVPQG